MSINLLVKKIKETKNPVVVGLDPQYDMIPKYLIKESNKKVSSDLTTCTAIFEFNKVIIDHIYDIVPAVKLQIAFYEMLGFLGIKAYEETIRYAKEKELIVIGDIKRGDVSSTAKAYSQGHIGRVNGEPIYNQNFITINPYLGFDSIEPFLEDCEDFNRGLFILLKTSNPGSRDIQDIVLQNGKPLYIHVAELIRKWGEPSICSTGFSKIGAVVGATHPNIAKELRNMLPNTMFLVPGYGVQGGTAKNISNFFTNGIEGALINNSRGIIYAYQNNDKYKPEEFGEAARQATLDMIEDIRENI